MATGATKWGDPKNFPWTMAWQPNYQSEARIYAKYLLDKYPNAKIGILYQNDDYGKDYVKGMQDGLGAKAKTMIVSEQPYETTDTTVDSQVINLKASGADVFFNVTTHKVAGLIAMVMDDKDERIPQMAVSPRTCVSSAAIRERPMTWPGTAMPEVEKVLRRPELCDHFCGGSTVDLHPKLIRKRTAKD